jgi:hypothetical protein
MPNLPKVQDDLLILLWEEILPQKVPVRHIIVSAPGICTYRTGIMGKVVSALFSPPLKKCLSTAGAII